MATETAMEMEMVTAMETGTGTAMEIKQQTVPAKAMEKWIAMARETENPTVMVLATPRQRPALSAKTTLEEVSAKRAIDTSMVAR
jgi:hypothetical protein